MESLRKLSRAKPVAADTAENPAAATEDPDPWEDLQIEERRKEVHAAMPELESWV